MPRPRTILAVLAVVLLSIMVGRIRGASVNGQLSHARATVSVDGAAETISVALPAEAVELLRGPVALSVQTGPGHVVQVAGNSEGAFPLAIQVETAAGHADELSVAADVKIDEPVEFGLAIAAPDQAPVAVHGSSSVPLVATFELRDLPVVAQAP
ncbi:MAG TPA: hypothetical protein VKV26_00895 [Dehalococcoidia bacterium]|nr:hypothetical protein [Dehalococcoidia bacterium]